MTFGSLFSGIGGLDLGLERAGMECKWQVEIDPFCTKDLEKHWPGVQRRGDIKDVRHDDLEGVDLLAGGFPCQDLSVAGRQDGIRDGNRSGLWGEFARLIGDFRPGFVLIENVSGLLVSGAMRRVLGDLSSLGYDAEWESIPAAAVGAPHIRDRVWIFAHARSKHGHDARGNYNPCRCDYLFPKRTRGIEALGGKDWKLIEMVPGIHPRIASDWWLHQSRMDRSVNGLSREVVDRRNGQFGNAVVPQVAEWIGRRIMEHATPEELAL